jgi:hypothetical protein
VPMPGHHLIRSGEATNRTSVYNRLNATCVIDSWQQDDLGKVVA